MHPNLAAHLSVRGFITRPQVFGAGLDDKSIWRALKSGDLISIGPGLYADRGYRTMTAEDQHRLRCHAVATRFPQQVAFTHQSAALLHGLPVWGLDLESLHVTRLDGGRGRRQAHVAHHVSDIRPDEASTVGGLRVSTPSRTVWDLACAGPAESVLVTADAALHDGSADDAELLALAARHSNWSGARSAKVALSLADRRSESPGESRLRWAIHEAGLPRPETQYRVFDQRGVLAGVADFAWPEFRHIVEFDGLVKYGSSADLAREKAREDLLRSLGWGITRIIWSQLSPGLRTALISELHEAMELSRKLYSPAA